MELLSCSVDKNVILWNFSARNNVWVPVQRIGEIGGQIVGYHCAIFSPDHSMILCQKFFGAFDLWEMSLKVNAYNFKA